MSQKKTKKVLMVPDYRAGNPYQSLLANSLRSRGVDVLFANYPTKRLPLMSLVKQFPDVDVLHVHWISSLVERSQWSKGICLFYLRCLIMVFECLLIRFKGKKIVWTIHNKKCHEQFDVKKEFIFRRLFFRVVNRAILHSKEAVDVISELYKQDISSKTDIIFHGNYQDVYPKATATKVQLKAQHGITEKKVVIAYFGNIKPYKGLELLIESFKACNLSNKYLFLAGKAHQGDYEKELLRLIKNNQNITCKFNFLSNQEMIDVLELADFVCLPFSDTLTSGSTILAMTQGKPLILPYASRVIGCVPDDGVKYFTSKRELIEILNSLTFEEASRLGKINKDRATGMSWENVAKMTQATYDNLLCTL